MIEFLVLTAAMLVAGVVGYALGMREISQRYVDRQLRRETRLRHPAVRVRVTPGQIIERARRLSRGEPLSPAPWFVDSLGGLTDQEVFGEGAEDVADAPDRVRTSEDPNSDIETLGEVDRRAERLRTWIGEAPDALRALRVGDHPMCGQLITSWWRSYSGMTVICLRDQGHKGECLP